MLLKYSFRRIRPDLQNNIGTTALITSSEHGFDKIVEVLVDAGAKLDVKNNIGTNALIFASYMGHKNVVKILVKAKAMNKALLDYIDIFGSNALISSSMLGYKDIVEILIKAGATLDLKDTDGHTAVSRASKHGNKDVVEMLIHAGAELNSQNTYGVTALISASSNDYIEIVEMLINAGAKIDLKNTYEKGALIIAYEIGNTDIVKLLIEAGADVNIENAGDSVFMKFVKKFDFDMVKFILHHSRVEQATLDEAIAFISSQPHRGDAGKIFRLLRARQTVLEKVEERVKETIGAPGRYLSYKTLETGYGEFIEDYQTKLQDISLKCRVQGLARDDLIKIAWKFYRSTKDENKVIFINAFGKFHDLKDIEECQDTKKKKGLDVCTRRILTRMTEPQLCELFE